MPEKDTSDLPVESSWRDTTRAFRKRSGDHFPLEEVTLLAYLPALYTRRWTALPIFFAVALIGAAYSFTTTPIYEARARLLIDVDNPNVLTFKQVIEQDRDTPDFYQTQYELMKSRRLARRTVDALGLWTDARFLGRDEDGRLFRLKRLVGTLWRRGTPVQASVSRPALPVRESTTIETAAQQRVIDAFLARLTVSPVRNSRLVEVRFEATDPVLAAAVVNALAHAYVEQNLERKFTASKEATGWLAQRLAEQRQSVEASELAIQRYRERNDGISLEERQNIVVQKLADLNTAATRAKTERIQKEATYARFQTLQHDPSALDTHPAVLSNGLIQDLKSELAALERQSAQLTGRVGERHPELVKLRSAIANADAKVRGEIAKVVESIQHDFLAARSQERQLLEALDAQKQEVLDLNRKSIEYGALQRDAAMNRQMFESLLQRTKETDISGELRTSNVQIVDDAEVPRGPVRPRHQRDLLLAILAAAVLASGVVLLLEQFDTTIKNSDDVKTRLSLPLLGLLPTLPAKTMLNGAPLLGNGGVSAQFSEAFRMIRTNVLFSSAAEGLRSIVVTSSGPNEGKTLVSSNLSLALAQAGHRVLLVDADMRRPRIHQLFGETQEPGLSNVIVGNVNPQDAIRRSTIPGFSILPCGFPSPNPAELLGSPRFREFLSTLKKDYDWVIIDSPPVLAVSDASILAHSTSGVVFVLAVEITDRRAAEAAVEQLETARARFVGAVLNRVNEDRATYQFAPYYGAPESREHTITPRVGAQTT